ncbi:MAG: S-methyl-5-thioribose-1-phosphate isomerase, partial [Spirochaetales bacterium]|nr:S-methyl-5-thioribose-1-phosphate isomerase [Spirochaetales bacterium]
MRIHGKHFKTVWFENGKLQLINQPLLPFRFEILSFDDFRDVAEAIRIMIVRGAPAIGATAAYGMALAEMGDENIEEAAVILRATRPTAQDLFYGIDAVTKAVSEGRSGLDCARALAEAYEKACLRIGELGAELIKEGMRLNTHCNAGGLATVDWGTAT